MYKYLSFFGILFLLFSACSESVETRLELEYPFSVFGIINPKADTHAVRIFEIKQNIALVHPDPIDANVTTTRMHDGQTFTWRDSVIQLGDGDYRHVYWSEFNAAGAETYHLKVTRSDGAQTEAVTTIPPPVTLKVLEPDTLIPGQALMPLLIEGAPPTLPRIDVEYVLVGLDASGTNPIFRPVMLNYQGLATPDPDGFLLNIDLQEDYRSIFKLFDADDDVSTTIIELREMNVTVHIGDSEWISPVGFFDEDFLVEPGSFSNVTNGFGYFGSGYTESISFRPPLALLRRTGFYIPGGE